MRHSFASALFLFICLVTRTYAVPSIASLSSSQTLTEGVNLTLSVSVNGTAPFTYQWRKEGTAISGATNSTLAFTPLRTTNAGTYTVYVTDATGSITSGPVVLAVNPAVAPSFSYQPSPITVVTGETLNFYASVSGTGPMTYEWKKGTTTVATTTTSSYSKANASSSDAGSYTVTVTNIAGSVTSNPFTVTVNAPTITAPTFGYSLSNQTVATGGSIDLYIYSVSGTSPITYQWKKDGVAIAGASSYSYYKSNVTSADAGDYTLTATNSAGSTTSNVAKITVLAPVAPTITSISSPVSVVVGGGFSLSVSASGTAPLSYQWRKDGVDISSALNASYSKSNVQTSDAGVYHVVVSNAQGSTTSGNVTVSVTNARPPVITSHPASRAFRQGEFMDGVYVGASGTGTLGYQWRKDGVNIAGATYSSLNFYRTATTADAGNYSVVVSNAQGSATSEPCYITILPTTPPFITAPALSLTLRQGEAINLYTSVSSVPTATVQWRKDGVEIAGATSATYYKANVASSDAGAYTFVATNSAGSATSAAANITVIALAPPQIVTHPASASLLPGDSFYGMYVGTSYAGGTQTIQWYRDGVLIPGATNSTYYIYGAQPSHAGTYKAIVTNSAGSTTSREAVLTVDSNVTRPVFTYVPGGSAIAGGASVSLSVSTSSSGETVQWFKDGLVIPNATSKQYSFSNFALGSVGTYTVQVTNTSGTFTSRPIVLELLDAGMAPLIRGHPQSRNFAAWENFLLMVSAEGEKPLTYQWRKDGVAISGATSSEFYVTSTGAYSVIVSNRNGSATSAAATISLISSANTAPVIARHPASQATPVGSGYLSFSVSLFNSTGVTYQWRKDGVNISGATYSSLTLSPVSTSHAGRYSVVATNSAGSTTSYDAILTVMASAATGPSFTQQPQSVESVYGATVSFSATATGTSTVSYQWRKNGVNISGATGSSLSLSNVQSGDAATYTVVATDSVGSTSSAAATLTLIGGVAPSFQTHPASATVLTGQSVTFSVSVTGTPQPTIQWRKDGSDISGATASQYTIASVQAANAGSYTAVARNAAGTVTSGSGVLTLIYPPPVITAQPLNVSTQTGGTAVFTVAVSSVPTPTYQWRKDGVPITGATTTMLSLTNVQVANAGSYSVLVTTAFGSATSVDALLTVGNPVAVTLPRTVTAIAGTHLTLAATVQSVDPLLFRWSRNGVIIPGATNSRIDLPSVQVSSSGTYVLEVRRTDGTVIYPFTGSAALVSQVTITEPPRSPLRFLQYLSNVTVSVGESAQLSALVEGSGGVLTYQWQKDGTLISNATGTSLTLNPVTMAMAGDYRIIASEVVGQQTNTIFSTARLTVLGSPFAGTYFGTFPNGDGWALHVREDGTAAFVGMLSGRGQAIIRNGFTVQPDGTFRFGQQRLTAGAGEASYMTWLYDGEVTGRISANIVSGQIPGAGLNMIGTQATTSSTPRAGAGYHEAVPLASDLGLVAVIAGPEGSVQLVAVDSVGARGGRGLLTENQLFSVVQPRYSYSGSLANKSSDMSGSYSATDGAVVSFASATPSPSILDRMINVATRGYAGSDAKTLTAGFVIRGSEQKEVLVRAVGPGLTPFGVQGTLANPRLKVFRDGTPVVENDDWGQGGYGPQIAAAITRSGAFALPAGSVDAAVLMRLDPGAYTAQVSTGPTDAGVALIEVYDTTDRMTVPGNAKLVNLSTRGEVGRDGDILIVGIVITGGSPRKLLIRGIGPTLTDFGVGGALADPRLQLYREGRLLRENDNWSEGGDAALLATAASAVGAFALPNSSKDAAMLVYLPAGAYTAQVSGVGGGTGVGLVEVYEVP